MQRTHLEPISALYDRYGAQLGALTKDEKCIILAKLIEWVGNKDSSICIWMRTGVENLSPELRTLLLDIHGCATYRQVNLMVDLAQQLQANIYAPNP